MSFNGSGSFTPPASDFPAVALTLIESAKFNAVINDIATGLSTVICKDGQTTITANLPMGGFRHTGVGAATASGQYGRVNEIQDGSLIYGGTAGGTADALTLTTVPTFSAYATGMVIRFKSGASPNTGAATLQVNGISSPPAIQKNGAALAANDIQAGKFYEVIYDGTAFQLTKLAPTLRDAIGTAKGDLIAYTAAGTPARVAVGTNGQIPVAKSGATPGIDWDWINDFTEDTAALAADFLLSYDTSAGDHKKVATSKLPGEWELINTYAPSAAASQAVTGFDSAVYTNYKIILEKITPATDAQELFMRTSTDGGSSFDSGASDYDWVVQTNGAATSDDADSEIAITGTTLGTAGNEYFSGEMLILNPGAAAFCDIQWEGGGRTSAPGPFTAQGRGTRLAAADVNAVQFLFASGNIASGTMRFYGLRKPA